MSIAICYSNDESHQQIQQEEQERRAIVFNPNQAFPIPYQMVMHSSQRKKLLGF